MSRYTSFEEEDSTERIEPSRTSNKAMGHNQLAKKLQTIQTTSVGSYITWDLRTDLSSTVIAPANPVGDVLYATFQLRPKRDLNINLPQVNIPSPLDVPGVRQPSPFIQAINDGFIPGPPSPPQQMTPPRTPVLEVPKNQYLLQMYFEIVAPRMAATSPLCLDLFGKEIPAMAQEFPALMEAMLALAAIQGGLLRHDEVLATDAAMHYEWALRGHFRGVADPELMKTDIPLATSLLLAFYELWNGELVKMGVHMLGGRNVILSRGKEAHTTPVGRALLATFVRTDIGTSTITGNPCFMTNEWWRVDPLIQIKIPHDAPTEFVTDAAVAKLCLICNKLTHLKRWALDRRRNIWLASQTEPWPIVRQKKYNLQRRIEAKAAVLEDELEEWYGELPPWYRPSHGENDSDEDINDPLCPEIYAKPYPHPYIPLALCMSYAAQLQLFRIQHPSPPQLPPHLGSLAHSILRAFEFLPSTSDISMLPWVFTAGIELRRKSHQQHLLASLTHRLHTTGLYPIGFARDGLAFAYAKLAGLHSGRFIKVKEDATERFPGISENMWNAEGVLGQLEALSLYDSEDMREERWRFKGDFGGMEDDERVGYEVAEMTGELATLGLGPEGK